MTEYFEGQTVREPHGGSYGEVVSECKSPIFDAKLDRDLVRVDVKVTKAGKGSHHKDGDRVIWREPHSYLHRGS